MTNSPPAQDLFSPFTVGPLTLRNRFIKSATNEGGALGGRVSKALVKHHEEMAAGGVAMTTLAYCAVNPDGRTFPDQIELKLENLPALRLLTDAVHKHGAAASAQITHGGCFTFLRDLSTGRPDSSSGGFDKIGVLSGRFFKRAMDYDRMALITADFVTAAKLAREAGFDAVEIHMGHGYLLSQFLSPGYNKRRDEFGGSAEKRARFPAKVLRAVLDAVGDDMAVLCKIGVIEGFRGGGTAEDAVTIARALEREGAHMLVLSGGMNVEAVTQLFGNSLPSEAKTSATKGVIRLGLRLQAQLEKKAPFHEMYFLEHSRKVRAAVEMPLAFLGGVSSLDNAQQALREGFDCLVMGRPLLREPDLIHKFERGVATRSDCNHCNHCVVTMYKPGGTHCVLRTDFDPILNSIPAIE